MLRSISTGILCRWTIIYEFNLSCVTIKIIISTTSYVANFFFMTEKQKKKLFLVGSHLHVFEGFCKNFQQFFFKLKGHTLVKFHSKSYGNACDAEKYITHSSSSRSRSKTLHNYYKLLLTL